MLILDTDHLAEYQKGTSAEAQRLKQRLDEAGDEVRVSQDVTLLQAPRRRARG